MDAALVVDVYGSCLGVAANLCPRSRSYMSQLEMGQGTRMERVGLVQAERGLKAVHALQKTAFLVEGTLAGGDHQARLPYSACEDKLHVQARMLAPGKKRA
jgi:hypothetical protein